MQMRFLYHFRKHSFYRLFSSKSSYAHGAPTAKLILLNCQEMFSWMTCWGCCRRRNWLAIYSWTPLLKTNCRRSCFRTHLWSSSMALVLILYKLCIADLSGVTCDGAERRKWRGYRGATSLTSLSYMGADRDMQNIKYTGRLISTTILLSQKP